MIDTNGTHDSKTASSIWLSNIRGPMPSRKMQTPKELLKRFYVGRISSLLQVKTLDTSQIYESRPLLQPPGALRRQASRNDLRHIYGSADDATRKQIAAVASNMQLSELLQEVLDEPNEIE
jgi:hypothetical protein